MSINCERITQTNSQQSYSVKDELATGIVSFKTITNLFQCTEECTYWIAAKVVNLELERGWSYLACNKCTKKVDKIGNNFFCKKCNEEQCSVGHRYRLQVCVIDGTAFISLLLWNREVMQIIGKSAKELKQGLLEASVLDDDRSYPSELDDILYKRFMFKDSVIPDGQSSGGEKQFGDFMAESQVTSTPQTPIQKSISESGSSVVEDGADWKAKLSPLKTYDKRTRSSKSASGVIADDDLNCQLSSKKVRKVIKKEKNP
ncbi:PREDICTED: replication protein A 70 kDa DNA-binding subunit A-like [Nicotiana attenuata]|uniref:replication protein A 70 kDa DNA-binding subunit A-like n=1 Tax=Nicotiana attenuata TaxID=49451 RepID=UPI0009055F1D|nr:PREDICTED: replication protein A 70 kDa DNA-binding subunit A-like [Nicotiana attenuata]